MHWYEIVEILGQGGFGITYLALDTNLKQQVAIKEYLPIDLAVREDDQSIRPISTDATEGYSWGLDRFIAEAQTLAQFDHPNIVRVRTVFEANKTAYMVMGFEEGQPLSAVLDGGDLDERRLLDMALSLKFTQRVSFIGISNRRTSTSASMGHRCCSISALRGRRSVLLHKP